MFYVVHIVEGELRKSGQEHWVDGLWYHIVREGGGSRLVVLWKQKQDKWVESRDRVLGERNKAP